MRSAKLDGFLDGFTSAGLFAKPTPPGTAEEYRTAVTFMYLGAATMLAIIAAFTYLVIHGREGLGYFLLGVYVAVPFFSLGRTLWLRRQQHVR